MNIAIFASAYYPSLGGVEEVCRQLAAAFVKAGHPTIIVTNRWPRDLAAQETIDGIPVYRFPMRVPTTLWKSRLSYALTHRPIRSAINRVLQNHRIDVIHAQCVSSTTLYALYSKQKLRIPLVATLHGEISMDAGGIFQRPGIARDIMHQTLDEADAITACSRHSLEEARIYHGCLKENSIVIHNGIRLAEFANGNAYAHAKPYVLAIGRLVKQKGFDVLLRAWSAVDPRGHDLILAGDGPDQAALKRLVDTLKIADRVVFFGRADRERAVALFKGCAFFVLPSRHEPFGIVSLEAMAAGKTVLATRVGGVPEVVEDGVTGLLVEPESPAAMSQALDQLLASPELLTRLGNASFQRAANYDWATPARKYLDVLAGVISNASAATKSR